MAGVSFDWNAAAAVASAVSAIAAALSAFLSYRAMRTASRIAKEQRASQAVLQFVDLSLRHTKLSTSYKGEDYEWYINAVLELAREVLTAYPNDPMRRRQMKMQLSFHRAELADWSKNKGYKSDIDDYGPDVAELVRQVVDEPLSKVAAE